MNNDPILRPVETTNLNESVYHILRQWITEGSLLPGQRLNLLEIESSLQVSRTPVKTALKRLELEGLVEIQPRSGTFIAQMDAKKLEENYKIRTAFELYVALCLFKYLTDVDYEFFNHISHEMNQLVDFCNDDWHLILSDYIELDRQFHERLLEKGGPERMLLLSRQMNIHGQLKRIIPLYHNRELQSMHFEHQQILSSIVDRSPERLSATLLNHLESARHRSLKYFSQAMKLNF